MDKKLKNKWVKALRSGKFRQGREALKVGNKRCCLAVLCDAAGAVWKKDEYGNEIAVLGGEVINQRDSEVLRPVFLRRIGLTKHQQILLVDMNDGVLGSKGHGFKKIADYIDENL